MSRKGCKDVNTRVIVALIRIVRHPVVKPHDSEPTQRNRSRVATDAIHSREYDILPADSMAPSVMSDIAKLSAKKVQSGRENCFQSLCGDPREVD